MQNNPHTVKIANGNLYLDKTIYLTYFKNIESVILLFNPPSILLMPVHQVGSGGLLLKIRTARGDRVVNILEFLENNDLQQIDATLPVVWNTKQAALCIRLNESV